MTTSHPSRELIARYVDADASLDEASAWTLEAHLETCPVCRDTLAERVYAEPPEPAGASAPSGTRPGISDAVLLARVGAALAEPLRTGPAPAPVPRRWSRTLHRWAVWSFLPWVLTTGLVLLAALGLDTVAAWHFSLVLAAAPVAPLLGVAAAWNRRTDPAWELVTGSPRSGVWLLLRRSLVVLAVVMPVAAVVSLLGGHSPVAWLLPSLALTATTLALGGRFGVQRVAGVIAAGWAVAVLAPGLRDGADPVVLTGSGAPAWSAVAVAAVALLAARAGDYRHLASRQ